MLPTQMHAAVMQGFGQPLALRQQPLPEPAEDEVLLQVRACGVCHSDLHILDGDTPAFKPITKPELIPGHEVVGTVLRLGTGVRQLALGQRVGVAWMHWSCGQCELCRDGMENLCRQTSITGLRVNGGYAQYMVAKADFAIPVPDALDDAEAAPLFCAGVTSYRAVTHAGVQTGQRVAVVGVGGLGHLALQIARARGAEVIAIDVADDKLAAARALGAAHAFDARSPETPRAVRALGLAHVVIVTSAARAAYDLAIKLLRPGGTLSVVGLPPEPLSFAALQIVGGEFRIVGSSVGTRDDIRATLAMAAAGELRCHAQRRPLEQINEVLDDMRAGRIATRTVLDFGLARPHPSS
ncbi:MAG: zinc-dependent alcohol dehydrogenase [Burkholderiaceae bacterium]|nr:zinc-dependent alcohol dehydrogenase [Burkholderiaceae bacterium]